jgi:hypothetical protein
VQEAQQGTNVSLKEAKEKRFLDDSVYHRRDFSGGADQDF